MISTRSFLPCSLLAVSIVARLGAAPPTCDPNDAGLKLPPGFCALVAADGLGEARHMAVAANGDAYVALLGAGEKGGVMALRDADGDGRFEVTQHFGEGSLTGIEIHDGYLYVAAPNEVRRYKPTAGQLVPTGGAEVIVSGLPGVRQHGDKDIAFDGAGGLYVNVGAPSNACQVRDRSPKSPGQDPCPILEKNGGVWKFDAAKTGQTQASGTRFATGLRQMPALAWHDGALFIAMNNRDSLDSLWPGQFTAEENAERPAEPLYRAVQGSNFGWPFCFFDYGQKKLLLNPEYGGDGKTVGRCDTFTPPTAAFPAHWAPLDLLFYDGTQFPAKYRNGVFIAFHGSWNRSPNQRGYNVVFQPLANGKASGAFEIFADGFIGKDAISNPNDAAARPDGLAQAPDGSLYVTDSQKGKVWRIIHVAR